MKKYISEISCAIAFICIFILIFLGGVLADSKQHISEITQAFWITLIIFMISAAITLTLQYLQEKSSSVRQH